MKKYLFVVALSALVSTGCSQYAGEFQPVNPVKDAAIGATGVTLTTALLGVDEGEALGLGGLIGLGVLFDSWAHNQKVSQVIRDEGVFIDFTVVDGTLDRFEIVGHYLYYCVGRKTLYTSTGVCAIALPHSSETRIRKEVRSGSYSRNRDESTQTIAPNPHVVVAKLFWAADEKGEPNNLDILDVPVVSDRHVVEKIEPGMRRDAFVGSSSYVDDHRGRSDRRSFGPTRRGIRVGNRCIGCG